MKLLLLPAASCGHIWPWPLTLPLVLAADCAFLDQCWDGQGLVCTAVPNEAICESKAGTTFCKYDMLRQTFSSAMNLLNIHA